MSPFRILIHCLLGLSLLLGAAGDGMARTMEIGAKHAAAMAATAPVKTDCHEALADSDTPTAPADTAPCDEGGCTPQKACDCACQHLLAAVPSTAMLPAFAFPEDRWSASGSLTRHGPPPPRLIRPPILPG